MVAISKFISIGLCVSLLAGAVGAEPLSGPATLHAPQVVRADFKGQALTLRLADFRTAPVQIATGRMMRVAGIKLGQTAGATGRFLGYSRIKEALPDLIMLGVSAAISFALHYGVSAPSGVLQACGLVGVLMRRGIGDTQIVPERIVRLFTEMGRITKVRGEQAAGAVVFLQNKNGIPGAVRQRVVNAKRSKLPEVFEKAFDRALKLTRLKGFQPLADWIFIMGHYRYGTSSAPAVSETHPHQWVPDRDAHVYRVVQGHWQSVRIRLSTFIAHNGDFDDYPLFGQYWNNFQIGLWLERVLQTPSNLRGDSPKIAGMMDLLVTQGMWDASARFAHQFSRAQSLADAFGGNMPPQGLPSKHGSYMDLKAALDLPNTAPTATEMAAWGKTFERIFLKYQQRLLLPNAQEPWQVNPTVQKMMMDEMVQAFRSDTYSEEVTRAFVKTTVHAFLHNDMNTATKLLMKRAKGFFGLSVSSTLFPAEVVLGSLNQWVSVGFDPALGKVAWASDPAVMKALVAGEPGMPWRLDLAQDEGEIIQIKDNQFRLFNFAQNRELSLDELREAKRLVELTDNPLITPLPAASTVADPVAADIADMSKVLRESEKQWNDAQSLNRRTAKQVFYQLLETAIFKNLKITIQVRVKDESPEEEEVWQQAVTFARRFREGKMTEAQYVRESKQFVQSMQKKLPLSDNVLENHSSKNDPDFVVSGVETSLKEGESFVAFIKKMFPTLIIVSESSNTLLAALHDVDERSNDFRVTVKTDKTNYKIGKRTRALFISQSGQTYSTLNAAKRLYLLQKKFGLNGVFGLTGELDGGLGWAVGQTYSRDSEFNEHLFINGSGRRPAEASSVATAAADYSLTRLALYLAQEMHGVLPVLRPFRLKFSAEKLAKVLALLHEIVEKNVPEITGVDAQGRQNQSPAAAQLREGGRHWADHVLEAPRSHWMGWVFLALTEAIRWTPGLLFAPHLPVAAQFLLLDLPFYYLAMRFGMPFLLRLLQKRQLWARFVGRRKIFIGDVPYISSLQKAYVEKLFAMAPAQKAVDVEAGDASTDFIHRIGHQMVRGSLVFFGLPSRRTPRGQVNMTGSQLNGVQNGAFGLKAGPEIVMIGERLDEKPASATSTYGLPSSTLGADDTDVTELYEMRVAPLQRLTASYVFFHAMARKVSDTLPMHWPVGATQSGTRVASTMAPVSAPDTMRYQSADTASLLKASRISFIPFAGVTSHALSSKTEAKSLEDEESNGDSAGKNVSPGQTLKWIKPAIGLVVVLVAGVLLSYYGPSIGAVFGHFSAVLHWPHFATISAHATTPALPNALPPMLHLQIPPTSFAVQASAAATQGATTAIHHILGIDVVHGDTLSGIVQRLQTHGPADVQQALKGSLYSGHHTVGLVDRVWAAIPQHVGGNPDNIRAGEHFNIDLDALRNVAHSQPPVDAMPTIKTVGAQAMRMGASGLGLGTVAQLASAAVLLVFPLLAPFRQTSRAALAAA